MAFRAGASGVARIVADSCAGVRKAVATSAEALTAVGAEEDAARESRCAKRDMLAASLKAKAEAAAAEGVEDGGDVKIVMEGHRSLNAILSVEEVALAAAEARFARLRGALDKRGAALKAHAATLSKAIEDAREVVGDGDAVLDAVCGLHDATADINQRAAAAAASAAVEIASRRAGERRIAQLRGAVAALRAEFDAIASRKAKAVSYTRCCRG